MANLSNLFKIDGKPINLSPKQQEIFDLIVYRKHPRNQIIAPTQWGKSLTVGLAVLTSAVAEGEKFSILAPTEKKAQIIMGYVIEHAFDRAMFLDQLQLDPNENLDRLRRERSKQNITFKSGGGVQVLTLDARNSKRSIEAVMGFGSKNIIEDESALIEDGSQATVLRMLGGYPYKDQFLLKIGNPFNRNHFYRTWHSPRYHKIFINYEDGLREGRYSKEFIEEMQAEPFFDILYECKFPAEDAIDDMGYRVLTTLEQLDIAFTDSKKGEGELRLGADIGGGGDANVYVLRNNTVAWVENTNKSKDTMTNVTEIERIMDQYKVEPSNVFIDDTGIGRGVSDRLTEKGYATNGVTVGAKAMNETKFKNIKAEDYWLLREWLRSGGKLVRNEGFKQLINIKYKVSTDKVLQMEPKELLLKRVGKSPDYADALMLTFTLSTSPILMFS